MRYKIGSYIYGSGKPTSDNAVVYADTLGDALKIAGDNINVREIVKPSTHQTITGGHQHIEIVLFHDPMSTTGAVEIIISQEG